MTRAKIPIETVKLTSAAGLEVGLVSLGARLHEIHLPVRGAKRNVLLGYASPEAYADDPYFMGATVGRYAGRIAGGRCPLNGATLTLARAGGEPATLHGGPGGLHSRHWTLAEPPQSDSALFAHNSARGDQGFPGNAEISVRYSVRDLELHIELTAEVDRDTVMSLTNHAYFNLDGTGSVDDHWIELHSGLYLDVDDALIPSGKICDVAGTRFDLRTAARLGDALGESGIDLT